uniref:Dehydration responsive factor 1 variant 1.2 type b n=1 Tax=Triticum turgidum subsp. durum TaxID=4567 RepID=E0WB48_TRITD|nr:dehydration responsive factor 1 variant 1.2 type b [Triticum turgidum subsp. durum]
MTVDRKDAEAAAAAAPFEIPALQPGRTCGAEESIRSHVLVKPIGKSDLGDHVMGLIQSLKRSGDGKK